MSETLARIQVLVAAGNYAISDHAYEEAENDAIDPMEIIRALAHAVVVEDYPDANRGPSVLAFCRDDAGLPLHATWGTHKTNPNKAVLITVYRPNTTKWTPDYLRRL